MNQNDKTLVIGIGNTLRGDDALGRISAERVLDAVDSQEVRVISQCALTPELAAEIAEVALVIFLDASADGPSDRISTRRLIATDGHQPLAHRDDAPSLLALSGHVYGHIPDAFAITFRGRAFGLSDQRLSAEASAACDLVVRETLRLIDEHAAVR